MENTQKKVRLNSSTLSYFKDCFDRNGRKKNIDHLTWQFIDNSGGDPNSTMVVDEGTDSAIAVCATIVNPFKIGNKTTDATQGLDLLVDKEYRNQGLYLEVGKIMQAECIERKQALIYSFPNSNSVHALKKYLGWEILGTMPFLIRPLKTSYFTSRVKPIKFLPNINVPIGSGSSYKNIKITEKKEFPENVNKVWKSFSKDIKVTLHRDQNYLNWRYLDKPNNDYVVLHARDEKDNYIGYIVYSIKQKHKGSIGYIMELIYDLENPKAGDALLYSATKNIKKAGADCILSWCFPHSPNYKTFKNRSFFQLKEKLRPVQINFAVFPILKEANEMMKKRENWYLSYSDSDTA